MTSTKPISRPVASGARYRSSYSATSESTIRSRDRDPRLPRGTGSHRGKCLSQVREILRSINPATEEFLRIAHANAADVASLPAAQKAFPPEKLPGRERGKYLYPLARLIHARALGLPSPKRGWRKPITDSGRFRRAMAAAHSSNHSGWATSLSTAVPARLSRPSAWGRGSDNREGTSPS